MRTSEERLVQEIQELDASCDQAKVAVGNVFGLLQKADRRRIEGGDRSWNRILDNLKRALDLTRARLTKYEELLKERQRDLEQFRLSGQSRMPEQVNGLGSLEEQVLIGTLRDVLPEDVPLPRDQIRAAERILAMPLEFLGNLTIEEVMHMNAQHFEEPESESQRPPQDSQSTITKSSWLEERIVRARQAREALAASHRPEPSCAERRRQMGLRNAIEKVATANFNLLDLPEIDLIMQCIKTIDEKPEKGGDDLRLRRLIDRNIEKLNERASELRRRRAQKYLRKPGPNTQ